MTACTQPQPTGFVVKWWGPLRESYFDSTEINCEWGVCMRALWNIEATVVDTAAAIASVPVLVPAQQPSASTWHQAPPINHHRVVETAQTKMNKVEETKQETKQRQEDRQIDK